MTDDFNRPAEVTYGDNFNNERALGHLLIITAHAEETTPTKDYGPKPAIRADIIDVDAEEEFTDQLIFGTVLVPALRPYVGGQKVLARLGRGEKRGGNQPPWVLNDYSDEDKDRALAYLSGDVTPPPAAAPTAGNDEDAEIEEMQRKLEERQKKLLEQKLGAKGI